MIKFSKLLIFSYAVHLSCFSLTLDEALNHVYIDNASLKSIREDTKAEDEHIMQSIANFMPQVKFTEQIISRRNINGEIKRWEIDQNLFKGGRHVAEIQKSKYKIKKAHAKLISGEQSILLNAVEIYLRTLQALENYKVAQQKEEETNKYLLGIKTRVEAGQGTKTDMAQAEANAIGASANKARFYNDYEAYKAAFIKVVGMEPKNLSWPRENMELPKTLDKVITRALIGNPDLMNANADYLASESDKAGSAAALLPSIDLQFSKQKLDKTATDELNISNSGSQIILAVNVPIFSGGSDLSRIRQATRLAKARKYGLEDVRNSIAQSSTTLWSTYNSAKIILNAKKKENSAMHVAYDGIIAQEKAGLSDTIDVISIRNKYFDSSIDMLSSKVEYYLSFYKIKSNMGECTHAGLNLKSKPYDPMQNYRDIRWKWFNVFFEE